MPLISFVIPFFNRYGLVRNAVESVLSSAYTDVELILVDDCSDEQGLECLVSYLEPHKNITYIRQESQKGPGSARNRGIAVSKGEWIFFMDSDDLIAPGALDKLCSFIQHCQEADFIALTKLILRWPDGKEEYKNNGNNSKQGIEDNFFSKIAGYGSLWNYCFKRKFIADNSIECPEIYMDEDTCFLLSSYCYAGNISFYGDDFYIHYENTELSLSTLSRNFDFGSRKIINARAGFFSHILALSENNISAEKRELVNRLLAKHILCAYCDDEFKTNFLVNDKVKEISGKFSEMIYRYTDKGKKGVYIAPCFIDALNAVKILSECNVKVLGFIDNNPDSERALACKKASGLNVFRIKEIQADNGIVLIFGRHSGAIAKQYSEMGLFECTNYLITGLL
jgi:glycosyltransferase involved in cell wall biosynthesis